MALIHCPDCEREVSSRALACPQCAYPIDQLTNLFDAVRQNDIDMLRDLLRAGYKANETNEDGSTPLMLACQQGNYCATKLLVNAGAELDHQDDEGSTALMEAAFQGYDRIATFLIEQGADALIKNGDGFTAIDLALDEKHDDLVEILRSAQKDSETDSPVEEKIEEEPVPENTEEIRDASVPPIRSVSTKSIPGVRDVRTTSNVELPPIPVGPPPLPEDATPVQRVRLLDDLAPVIDEEKYAGPGLICRTCHAQIAAEDIWCSQCKAPIIRRYCGGCRQLIPDNAARCPYCRSSKLNHFRYIRHLEQIVGGAAVLGVLLFVLGIYSPNDSSSYARKLAEKRAAQQEQTAIAAEETSKIIKQQRTRGNTSPKTIPAVIRVIPRETDQKQLLKARGTTDTQNRIPTVERIELVPPLSVLEKDRTELKPQVGKPVEQSKPEMSGTVSEETTRPPEAPQIIEEPEGSGELAQRLNDQGFRLMKNGKYEEAIPVLAQAVRSFPPGKKNLTYAYALYNLGRSLRLAGRPDLAIPILEERMKFADQRHIVARELEQARTELNGPEPFDNVQFE